MKDSPLLNHLSFRSLVWPLFVDNFLRMVVLVASYGLVSRISDEMAGVLGVTNLYLLIGFTFSECLAQGGSIVLTHYLGAKKKEELQESYGIMVAISLLTGLVISVFLFNFSLSLVSIFGFSPSIQENGSNYLKLVGMGFCIYSINYAFLSILQAHGFTKYSMIYSLLVNSLSLLLYYIISIIPLDFYLSRLTLIAATNLFVRFIGMIFLFFLIRLLISNFQVFKKMPWQKAKQHLFHLLRIGIPSGIEPISYQMFQFTLVKIISSIGSNSLSIRSYLLSLSTLFETGLVSFSRGNQILSGHLVGAKEDLLLFRQLKKSIKASLLASSLLLFGGLLFRKELINIFSKNESIITIGSELLFLVAFLTLIRSFSLTLQGSLRATGDVKFVFLLSVFGMWCIVVPGAYILTHFFSMGLRGIWGMLILDELARVFFLTQRWKGQKWKKFSAARESAS